MPPITVSGLEVEVVRKPIKNLHLGVYPPHGRIRVAAPLALSDDAVRLAVITNLAWIKRQQAQFEAQPRQSRREMVSGESHYFQGQRCRLRVIERPGLGKVALRNRTILELHVPPGATAAEREEVLHRWYREQLKALVPPLLEKWQPLLGVEVADWGIKRMKTKWGSCSIEARRIWLALALATKPPGCLEYVLVHELAHLIERRHNDRFIALLDQSLPTWRSYRALLSHYPLAHEAWED